MAQVPAKKKFGSKRLCATIQGESASLTNPCDSHQLRHAVDLGWTVVDEVTSPRGVAVNGTRNLVHYLNRPLPEY